MLGGANAGEHPAMEAYWDRWPGCTVEQLPSPEGAKLLRRWRLRWTGSGSKSEKQKQQAAEELSLPPVDFVHMEAWEDFRSPAAGSDEAVWHLVNVLNSATPQVGIFACLFVFLSFRLPGISV